MTKTTRWSVAALVVLGSLFTSAQAASAAPAWPADTQYRSTELRGTNGGGPAAGTTVELTFREGNVIGFTAGCNSYGAHGVIRHGRLVLTDDLVGTLLGCPEDLQRTEEWFAQLVVSGPEFKLRSGGRLELRDDHERAKFTSLTPDRKV